MQRRKFTYDQAIQKASGNVIHERVTCFWSPEYASIESAIATTAKVQVQSRTREDCVPIGKCALVVG